MYLLHLYTCTNGDGEGARKLLAATVQMICKCTQRSAPNTDVCHMYTEICTKYRRVSPSFNLKLLAVPQVLAGHTHSWFRGDDPKAVPAGACSSTAVLSSALLYYSLLFSAVLSFSPPHSRPHVHGNKKRERSALLCYSLPLLLCSQTHGGAPSGQQTIQSPTRAGSTIAGHDGPDHLGLCRRESSENCW